MLAAVVYYERPYRAMWDGADYYWMDEDGEVHTVPSTSWDGWEPRPEGVPGERVKRGVAVSDKEYEAVVRDYTEAPWPA